VRVNEAYQRLKDPLRRGAYLCELAGAPIEAENNTAMPCVMEITKDTFTLRVVSGKDLIWSTGHCEAWLPKVDKQTLKAGASVEFKSTWALYRSASSCKQAKSLLGAGTYVASALYKETATDRFAFTITK